MLHTFPLILVHKIATSGHIPIYSYQSPVLRLPFIPIVLEVFSVPFSKSSILILRCIKWHKCHLNSLSNKIHLIAHILIVTLHAILYWNTNPCSPLSHFCFQGPCFISVTFLFSIITLTLDSILGTLYARPCLTFPVPCPFPIYPDQRFCNPVSDLLIPIAVLVTLHCSQ